MNENDVKFNDDEQMEWELVVANFRCNIKLYSGMLELKGYDETMIKIGFEENEK